MYRFKKKISIYLNRCHHHQYSVDWQAWRLPPLLYTIESMRVAAILPRSMVFDLVFRPTTFKRPTTSYLKEKKENSNVIRYNFFIFFGKRKINIDT